MRQHILQSTSSSRSNIAEKKFNQMPTPTTRDVNHIRSLLHSCALSRNPPSFAVQLHSLVFKSNLISSALISSSLFHFYSIHGSISSAVLSFSLIPRHSLSSLHFTSLISSLSCQSLFSHCLTHFRSMLLLQCPPDSVSLLTILSVSAKMSNLPFGRSVHLLFYKHGLPMCTKCYNTAMNLYFKCSAPTDAHKLFDEMIQNGTPNSISWSILLSGSIQFHGIDHAHTLFNHPSFLRNVASLSSMVAGYIERRRSKEAFLLLQDNGTFLHFDTSNICTILSSCSQVGDLVFGKWIHAHVTKLDMRSIFIDTALIDMYSKSGRIKTATKVFDSTSNKNVVTWNAMLNGLSMHGMANDVVRLFKRMIQEVKPDHITFVSVLSACSRAGYVELGLKLFDDMTIVYGQKPKVEHYACVVDLLGRTGKIEDAERIIRKMPMRPNEVVLGALIASCSLHGKLELGKKLMQELLEIDPGNTEYHVLLSNLCMQRGRHAEADLLWQEVKSGDTKKGPGMSYIEINGDVHGFRAGDRLHYRMREVHEKVDEMNIRLRSYGYVASNGYRGHDQEMEEKEHGLMLHSERLAVAFGLLDTKPGLGLRVFMNMRICSDCHTVMKLVSEIYKREIVIKDRNRFHTFRQGACSCSDYW